METVVQLAKKLRDGKLDIVELTEAVLEKISTCDDSTIFTSIAVERARTEAKTARQRLKAGNPASLVDGIANGWKDFLDRKGRVTTAGSVVLQSESRHAFGRVGAGSGGAGVTLKL